MDEDEPVSTPTITDRGHGEPVAAIVGGVHGDEPSGVDAVKSLLADEANGSLRLRTPARFIIANPPAVAAGKRFLEVDMNRSFPGDPAGHLEERLAEIVCEAVADIPTLALHATRSSGTPFAFAAPSDPEAVKLACSLSVPNLVLAEGGDIGSLSACGTVVTLEAGEQGSQSAMEQARLLSEEFLTAVGALEGTPGQHTPRVFEIGREIERPAGDAFEVLVENFTNVEAGEPFATVDGRELVAEDSFYPILLSANGYDDILGFRGKKVADSPDDLELDEVH